MPDLAPGRPILHGFPCHEAGNRHPQVANAFLGEDHSPEQLDVVHLLPVGQGSGHLIPSQSIVEPHFATGARANGEIEAPCQGAIVS